MCSLMVGRISTLQFTAEMNLFTILSFFLFYFGIIETNGLMFMSTPKEWLMLQVQTIKDFESSRMEDYQEIL